MDRLTATGKKAQLAGRRQLSKRSLDLVRVLFRELHITPTFLLRLFKHSLDLTQALFPVLLSTYLLLILLETIFEGSVSPHINLDYLLVIVIVVGIAAVLTAPRATDGTKEERLTLKRIIIITCAGIAGAAIIWYKTEEIGWLSYVISVVCGGLIVLLSILILREDEGEESEGKNSQGS